MLIASELFLIIYLDANLHSDFIGMYRYGKIASSVQLCTGFCLYSFQYKL